MPVVGLAEVGLWASVDPGLATSTFTSLQTSHRVLSCGFCAGDASFQSKKGGSGLPQFRLMLAPCYLCSCPSSSSGGTAGLCP